MFKKDVSNQINGENVVHLCLVVSSRPEMGKNSFVDDIFKHFRLEKDMKKSHFLVLTISRVTNLHIAQL